MSRFMGSYTFPYSPAEATVASLLQAAAAALAARGLFSRGVVLYNPQRTPETYKQTTNKGFDS